MDKIEKSLVITKGYVFYKSLLLLYPDIYRKKFGQEMLILFADIYKETIAKKGKVGFVFWFAVFLDTTKSALEQHLQLVKKQGVKKYLQNTLRINRYNIIGALLLLPFLSVFVIDLVARISQGDLVHYNRPVYNLLSHTLFYWTPILFIWVILFPTLAILVNLIPLIQNIVKKHQTVNRVFFEALLRGHLEGKVLKTVRFS